MKAQLIIEQPDKCHEHDNRQLVNLDFYENEISIMHQRLDGVLADHLTKKIKTRVDYLNSELNLQKLILERFRSNYDINETSLSSNLENKADSDPIKDKDSFFQHLQSFEKTFKDVRQEVLDFVQMPK